jgi:hypothetical protein
MTIGERALGALAIAAALAASGCGNNSCPTETPAQVEAVGSCSAPAGTTVNVPVRLCPTCNQSGASCSVDMSQASTGFIGLDPTVEACSSASSCGNTAPACDPNPLTCSVTLPSNASGSYTLVVFDPFSNSQKNGRIDVTSGAPSCAL